MLKKSNDRNQKGNITIEATMQQLQMTAVPSL